MENEKDKTDFLKKASLGNKMIQIEISRLKYNVSNLMVVLDSEEVDVARLINLEDGTYHNIKVLTKNEWYAYVEQQYKRE